MRLLTSELLKVWTAPRTVIGLVLAAGWIVLLLRSNTVAGKATLASDAPPVSEGDERPSRR